jgi:hypothetical protein
MVTHVVDVPMRDGERVKVDNTLGNTRHLKISAAVVRWLGSISR